MNNQLSGPVSRAPWVAKYLRTVEVEEVEEVMVVILFSGL